MENLDEKVYEILQTKDKFVSASEIISELEDVSIKDVMSILQVLCRQGVVSRKLIEGKVYFSTNLAEGETKNPNQKFIGDLQTTLNKISKGINDTIIHDDEKITHETENLNINSIKFEYKENKKFQNDKYEILIPDSFELEEDDFRDFVAYLKNPDDEDENFITIYPSHETPYNKNIPIISPTELSYLLLYDFTFWQTGFYLFKQMGGNIKYFRANLENAKARVISNTIFGAEHFYFLCCIKGAYKQIHIEINNIEASEEERKNMAIEIMNKFKCKEKITDVIMLNNKYFLENNITDELINEAIESIKMFKENLVFQFNFGLKVIEVYMQYKQTMGEFSTIDLKKKIRGDLRAIISNFEEFLKGSYEFILKAKSENVSNERLKMLYYHLNLLIDDNKELNLNVDEDKIVEESSYVELVYNEIFDNTILNLIKELE